MSFDKLPDIALQSGSLSSTPAWDSAEVTAKTVGEEAMHCVKVKRSREFCQGLASNGAEVSPSLEDVGNSEIKRVKVTFQAAGLIPYSINDRQKLDSLVDNFDDCMGEVANLNVKMDAVLAGQNNTSRRNYNALSQHGDHPLEALVVETSGVTAVGSEPVVMNAAPTVQGVEGIFPRTYLDLSYLNGAQLDALQVFYNRSFLGQSVAARQAKFRAFVGAK